MTNQTLRIRELNDMTRRKLSYRIFMTAGVSALDLQSQALLLQKVRAFDAFTVGNDPYGEHDFGAIDLAGKRYFWKFDYYALDMLHRSEDPSDTAKTRRVLTIMEAFEY